MNMVYRKGNSPVKIVSSRRYTKVKRSSSTVDARNVVKGKTGSNEGR
jgi:hypothetical protein